MRTVRTMAALCCMSRGALAFQTISRTSARTTLPFAIPSSSVRFNSKTSNKLSDEQYVTRLLASVDEEIDPGVVEGTDLRVLKYPHPSLRAENAEITQEELEDGSISKIVKEMFLVMYAAQGVGLAAPQVGINKQLMVYNESGDKTKWLKEVVMINPRIVEFSDAEDIEMEGCLSFPDMNGEVERSKWIKVRRLTQDRNIDR